MDKYFRIKESGSTVRTEVFAGITTFITMAYILVVNPNMLSFKDIPDLFSQSVWNGVFFATCIAAFIGTFLMGVWAKIPFAQAPGMGLNAFFAFTIMLGMGYTYPQALAFVFISGLLFILITAVGFREAVIKAIPKNIKIAISAGIGLFIAFIGLQNAGIVVNNDATLISLTNFKDLASDPTALWGVVLAVLGLFLIAVLNKFKVKGSIFISIIAITIIGFFTGNTVLPESFTFDIGAQAKDFADVSFFAFLGGFGDLFKGVGFFEGLFTVIMIILSFSIVDLFDTIGTLLGTAKAANLLDENDNMPRMKQALFCDAIATTVGAMVGTSTVTTYVESGAGIADGARTGLSSVVTSLLFIVALIFAPILILVPTCATAPALIFVGVLMMANIKNIDFEEATEAVPAFLTFTMMPFTYSISNGIALGLISYTVIKLFSGKVKDIHIITAILSILFILRFFFMGV